MSCGSNKNIQAVFLALIFTLKSGLGLYIHNWAHLDKTVKQATGSCCGIEISKAKCSCIEDALLPLIASSNEYKIKPPEYAVSMAKALTVEHRYFSAKIYFSRRGPPVSQRANNLS